MQKTLIAALLLSTLSACASPYGNYAHIADSANAGMADDMAHELTVLYPSATTHLTLAQNTDDAYGTELVSGLREAGYALEDGSSTASPVSESSSASISTTLPISYTVDRLSDGLYRVTVNIGAEAVSRVYSVTSDSMVPAGSWTRKE